MVKHNPFSPNSPVTPEKFAGRSREVHMLRRALQQTVRASPHHVLIGGERGMGKSSLALAASSAAARFEQNLGGDEERVVPVIVTCGGVSSVTEFVETTTAAIFDQAPVGRAAVERALAQFLASLGVRVGPIAADLSALIPQFTLAFPRVLRRVWTADLADKFGALQLVIDETDDLSRVSSFPGFLKSTLEELAREGDTNIQFVVTATTAGLATLVASHAAFPRSFDVLRLLPLSTEGEGTSELEQVVRLALPASHGYSKGFIRSLGIYSGGIPSFVQQMCFDAFEADDDDQLAVGDLQKAIRGTRVRRGAFEMLWDKHFAQPFGGYPSDGEVQKMLYAAVSLPDGATRSALLERGSQLFESMPAAELERAIAIASERRLVTVRALHGGDRVFISDPRLRILLRYFPDVDPEKHFRLSETERELALFDERFDLALQGHILDEPDRA